MTPRTAPSDLLSSLTMSHSRLDHPVIVVAAGGELDNTTASALTDYVTEVMVSRPTAEVLVLDMTNLVLLTAQGMQAVYQVCHRAKHRRLKVMLVTGTEGPVSGLLQAVTRRTPAETYPTRREAIAAAGPRRRRLRRPTPYPRRALTAVRPEDPPRGRQERGADMPRSSRRGHTAETASR